MFSVFRCAACINWLSWVTDGHDIWASLIKSNSGSTLWCRRNNWSLCCNNWNPPTQQTNGWVISSVPLLNWYLMSNAILTLCNTISGTSERKTNHGSQWWGVTLLAVVINSDHIRHAPSNGFIGNSTKIHLFFYITVCQCYLQCSNKLCGITDQVCKWMPLRKRI